ncbi:MAG: EamA family transporter [Lachnospiraceae bacterium]
MKQSFAKNKTGILLMLISSICACVGQLFWKLSAEQGIGIALLGFVFYGVGALVMLIAYRYGSLSVLQPMLSMNYVLGILLGAVVLQEPVTLLKILGVLVIMAGVVLIGGGDEE